MPSPGEGAAVETTAMAVEIGIQSLVRCNAYGAPLKLSAANNWLAKRG